MEIDYLECKNIVIWKVEREEKEEKQHIYFRKRKWASVGEGAVNPEAIL